MSLAWLLAQGDSLVSIPGTRHQAYLEENMATLELELDKTLLERAGQLVNASLVKGRRYGPGMEISLDPEQD